MYVAISTTVAIAGVNYLGAMTLSAEECSGQIPYCSVSSTRPLAVHAFSGEMAPLHVGDAAAE